MALLGPEVFIAIPSGTEWKADFGMSVAGMMASAGKPLKGGGHLQRVQLWNTKSSILPQARTTLVQEALNLKCSHILFIDSDQTFPVGTLHKLLSWEKDVVAANIATKTLPSCSTARLEEPGNRKGKILLSDENAHGLQRVWRVGTGIMLINLRVFSKIPVPWFPITWEDDHWMGEDWNFCTLLEKAGVPIYVDHDLSKTVGHVGSFTYLHEHVDIKE